MTTLYINTTWENIINLNHFNGRYNLQSNWWDTISDMTHFTALWWPRPTYSIANRTYRKVSNIRRGYTLSQKIHKSHFASGYHLISFFHSRVEGTLYLKFHKVWQYEI